MSMKNKGRYFTLLVIPHTEDSVLNIRVPLFLLQLASVLIVVSLLAAFIFFQSYLKLQHEVGVAEQMRDENRILNEQIDLLTSFTENLMLKVEQVEHLGVEVRKLVDLPPSEEDAGDHIHLAALTYDDPLRVLPGRGGNQVVTRTVTNITMLQEMIPQRAEEMAQLKESVLEHKMELAATPSIWPTRGRVSSEFGPRRSPFTGRQEFHDGIDIASSRGTPVYATADGKVTESAYRRGIGNVIIINHGYGYQTLYGHLSGFVAGNGDQVVKGQLIGYVGNTGMSTGPHLHYTVFVDGVAADPRNYLP